MTLQKPLPPLTLSEADMRQTMTEIGNLIVDHFVNLPNLKVTKPSILKELQGGLQEPLPILPTPMPQLIN